MSITSKKIKEVIDRSGSMNGKKIVTISGIILLSELKQTVNPELEIRV